MLVSHDIVTRSYFNTIVIFIKWDYQLFFGYFWNWPVRRHRYLWTQIVRKYHDKVALLKNWPWADFEIVKVNSNFSNSDYDLSEVCVDKCDDDYLQCVSSCSASECLLECGRALSACGDCELVLFGQIRLDFLIFSMSLSHWLYWRMQELRESYLLLQCKL